MKKTNHNYRNLGSVTSRICMAALALLGFGCSDDNGGGEPDMYGTPTAKFEVKGKVTDANGNGVRNAEVRITEKGRPSGVFSILKVKSDESGSYNLSGTIVGSPNEELKVVCIPADENLKADSTGVSLKKVENGDGAWYLGKGTATVDFRLKKKEAE